MAPGTYERLVGLVHDRAGETFRSAWRYDGDDWSALYVRDDIATRELRETIPGLLERARENEPIVDPSVYGRMGAVEAEVELHEDAVLVHFPETDSEGVVVTLDQEAAQDLAGFIERCNTLLEEG